MALNLEYEFTYLERPLVPVRFANPSLLAPSILTEALLDTGADVSLIDAELAGPLLLVPERFGTVGGIGGPTGHIAWAFVHVQVERLPGEQRITELLIGLVQGLAQTAGGLLGRDFFQHFDVGLPHNAVRARRRVYLGRIS